MLYWVHDGDQTPQHFPLQRLVRRVREEMGPSSEFFLIRAWGFGERINEWVNGLDALAPNARAPISFDELDRLSEGVEEWFYDVSVEAVAGDKRFEFGLHDSSCLYLDGDRPLIDKVAAAFSDVRVTEDEHYDAYARR
jgi:hypothetical protein